MKLLLIRSITSRPIKSYDIVITSRRARNSPTEISEPRRLALDTVKESRTFGNVSRISIPVLYLDPESDASSRKRRIRPLISVRAYSLEGTAASLVVRAATAAILGIARGTADFRRANSIPAAGPSCTPFAEMRDVPKEGGPVFIGRSIRRLASRVALVYTRVCTYIYVCISTRDRIDAPLFS